MDRNQRQMRCLRCLDSRFWIAYLALHFCAACVAHDEDVTVNPLHTFGITANNVFFYYDDVTAATAFYRDTLGLRLVADYGFAKILQVAQTSYLTLVDGTKGMHTTAEPKSVALALITNQLDQWYTYIRDIGLELAYDYDPVEGRPHHGFVVLDPEGYYLEFERFNAHTENKSLVPVLQRTETVLPDPAEITNVPSGLGFNATILWLYYRDLGNIQRFYEQKIGLALLVDQDWAKIYQTSPSGFIGLVDESRGMRSFSEEKAVTVSFVTDDLQGWLDYVIDRDAFALRSDVISADDERFRAFVGYDPEGYYLEFNTFLEHMDNEKLLESLAR